MSWQILKKPVLNVRSGNLALSSLVTIGTSGVNKKIIPVRVFFSSTFYLWPREKGRLPAVCDDTQVRETVSSFANAVDTLGTPGNSA